MILCHEFRASSKPVGRLLGMAKLFTSIFLLALSFSNSVHASDYGCKVLLCLANPNGPRAVSECVPPINQLFNDLSRGRSFPTCDLASSPSGGRSWAQQGLSYYDTCPTGTTTLRSGAYAVQGGPTSSDRYYAGIGDGDGMAPNYGEGVSMPGKVCVGNQLSTTLITAGDGDSSSAIPAGVYDRVVILDAQGSPNIIDVYVDSALYRRVRW